jgi:hypothetical protein
MSDCNIYTGCRLSENALATPIDCTQCDAKVPASAAIALEGTDYVWHFCGHDCLARWCDKIDHLRLHRDTAVAAQIHHTRDAHATP